MAAGSTTSLKLDDDIKGRVQRLAAVRRRSAHWLMREAIEQYVDREEDRERARQSALKAWKAYQATGTQVTAEDADAWLARLEAGEDAPPPEGRLLGGRSAGLEAARIGERRSAG